MNPLVPIFQCNGISRIHTTYDIALQNRYKDKLLYPHKRMCADFCKKPVMNIFSPGNFILYLPVFIVNCDINLH